MERRSAGAVVPFIPSSNEDDNATSKSNNKSVGGENVATDSSAPGILRSSSKSTFYKPSRIRFPPIKPVNIDTTTTRTTQQQRQVHFAEDLKNEEDENSKKQMRVHKFADWSVKNVFKRLLTQLLLVSLSLIAFDKRHLVLQIPRIGFAIYGLLGGPFPPYVDDQIFDYHEQWLQSGDVLISAPPKSGMTWMMYTLYRLRELDEFNSNCCAEASLSNDEEEELAITTVEKMPRDRFITKSNAKRSISEKGLEGMDEPSTKSKDNKFVNNKQNNIREIVEVSEIGPSRVGQDQVIAKQVSTTTFLDRAQVRTEIQSNSPHLNDIDSQQPINLKDDIEILLDDRFVNQQDDKKSAKKSAPKVVDENKIVLEPVNHFQTLKDQQMLKKNKSNNRKQIRDIYEQMRWTEFVYYPGQPLKERIEILKFPSTRGNFRIFKSHSFPPRVPLRPDIKYIVLARNPLDSIESARDFILSHHPLFAKMWGGFPFLEDFPESLWRGVISTEIFLHFFVLNFFKSWWEIRRNENVLIVHYSDRIQNDTTELTRIVRHLNLNVTQPQLNHLAKELTFGNIVQSEDKANIFHLDHVLDPFKLRNLVDKDVFVLDGHNSKAMLNKGPKRSRNRNTEEELRFKHRMEDTIRRYLEDDDAFSWLVR